MLTILQREMVYFWYYFELQLQQILPYWVLGILLGSVISVFVKDSVHGLIFSLQRKQAGFFGILAASMLGIASPRTS